VTNATSLEGIGLDVNGRPGDLRAVVAIGLIGRYDLDVGMKIVALVPSEIRTKRADRWSGTGASESTNDRTTPSVPSPAITSSSVRVELVEGSNDRRG